MLKWRGVAVTALAVLVGCGEMRDTATNVPTSVPTPAPIRLPAPRLITPSEPAVVEQNDPATNCPPDRSPVLDSRSVRLGSG
jgi:hypothetical protein